MTQIYYSKTDSKDQELVVPINQIDSQEQALSFKLKLKVHLYDPINQNASHPFIDALLEIHIFDFRLIVHLSSHVMMHNVSCVLTNALRICSLVQVTFFNCILYVLVHSLVEVLIHLIQLLFK